MCSHVETLSGFLLLMTECSQRVVFVFLGAVGQITTNWGTENTSNVSLSVLEPRRQKSGLVPSWWRGLGLLTKVSSGLVPSGASEQDSVPCPSPALVAGGVPRSVALHSNLCLCCHLAPHVSLCLRRTQVILN